MHPTLRQRLEGVRDSLMGGYCGGGGMSSSSRGRERELFLSGFLREVFPPPFRFGNGDITDGNGRSGQADIVVEYPFLPSLPSAFQDGPRLYLAEGVAAVIEVKSDLAHQWNEVEATKEAIKPLVRRPTMVGMRQGIVPSDIPLFAVGYRGWKTAKSVNEHAESGEVDAILLIDEMLFASSLRFGHLRKTGPDAIWAMISCLHQALSTLKMSGFDLDEYAPEAGPGTAPSEPDAVAEWIVQMFKSINGAPVNLDFGYPEFTEEQVAAVLEEGTGLQILNLNGTQVTDAIVPQLGRLQNLARLHVRHTRLTATGISQLKALLRDCKIYS